jgi:hypothetical protein
MFVGLAVPFLVSMAIRTRDREAGDGRRMASSRVPLVLVLEGSSRKGRTTEGSNGHARADPNHEPDNVLWGAPRIHSELLKLGIPVSQASVAKYIVRHSKPPSQMWRAFLANHVSQMVSVDFFTVYTIWSETLSVFVVLAHDRRRILHFNVTIHPTAKWTAQQSISIEIVGQAGELHVADWGEDAKYFDANSLSFSSDTGRV